MGEITAFEHAPDHSWSYVCGDATDAYNNPKYCDESETGKNEPKIDLFTRSLVYLPGANNLLVFDRVSALDPSYRKAWLLHSVGQPHVNGKIIKAEARGRLEDFDGDTVNITWEGGVIPPPDPEDPGRLFVKTFLPEERSIRRIGGDGHEFWVGGKNRPVVRYKGCLVPGNPHPIEAGRWRIEVSPAKPSKFDNFLHLIHICDTKTTRIPPAEMVTAEDEKMVGLAVGGWLALFGKKGEVVGDVSYQAPKGATEHLIVDLKRGAKYTVSGVAGGAEKMAASDEGTLRFATQGRAVVKLTPVE
jgi:heparin/heparan-sulfate lyase